MATENDYIALKADYERLRAALAPFAALAAGIPDADVDARPLVHVGQDRKCAGTFTSINVGHIRAAAKALEE